MAQLVPNSQPNPAQELSSIFGLGLNANSLIYLERARSYAERGDLRETVKWQNNFLNALGKSEAELSPPQRTILKQIMETAEIKHIPRCFDQAEKCAKRGDTKSTQRLLAEAELFAEKHGIRLSPESRSRMHDIEILAERPHLEMYLRKAREAAAIGLTFVCKNWLDKARVAFSKLPSRDELEKECQEIRQQALRSRLRGAMVEAINLACNGGSRSIETKLLEVCGLLSDTVALNSVFGRGVDHLRRMARVNMALRCVKKMQEENDLVLGRISIIQSELEAALTRVGTNPLRAVLDELPAIRRDYNSGDQEKFSAALGKIEQILKKESDALLESLGPNLDADKFLALGQGASSI